MSVLRSNAALPLEQCRGNDAPFPLRNVSWFAVDWAAPDVAATAAWHRGVLAATAWQCRGCKTRNSRLAAACGECGEAFFIAAYYVAHAIPRCSLRVVGCQLCGAAVAVSALPALLCGRPC